LPPRVSYVGFRWFVLPARRHILEDNFHELLAGCQRAADPLSNDGKQDNSQKQFDVTPPLHY